MSLHNISFLAGVDFFMYSMPKLVMWYREPRSYKIPVVEHDAWVPAD